MNAMLRISSMALATYWEAISPQTKSGFFSNRSGPGRNPHIMSPPSITAVVAEPGMPSVSIGTMAPAEAALFADSGPATPSMAPCLPLDRVSEEGGDRGPGPGQHADDEAQHGAARDGPARARPVGRRGPH